VKKPYRNPGSAGAVSLAIFLPVAILLASCYEPKIEDSADLDGRVAITIENKPSHKAGEPQLDREDLGRFPHLGGMLSADDSGIIGDGEASFLWRSGEKTVGGSSRTYVPELADIGNSFTVVAFRSRHAGGILSDPAYPLIDTDPEKTDIAELVGSPAITVANNGRSLEAGLDPGGNLNLQGLLFVWMRSEPVTGQTGNRNFVPIRGATGSTYRLSSLDRGRDIRLTVIHAEHSYYLHSETFRVDGNP